MKIKVMAVDDEPAVVGLLTTLLEHRGCEVVGLVDSRIAAHRLREEKVDGLFVDVRMPHLDGFELTRLTRESGLNAQVPIVMLTGLDDAETMRKGFEVGASFFLGKPFTRDRVDNLYAATRGPMLREKQRYLRLPCRTTVNCVWGPHGQGNFKSSSVDISEEGMSLSPSGGLDAGQEVSMRFALPDTPRPLHVKARVARLVPPNGIGVRFTELTPEDKEAILHYMAVRTKED